MPLPSPLGCTPHWQRGSGEAQKERFLSKVGAKRKRKHSKPGHYKPRAIGEWLNRNACWVRKGEGSHRGQNSLKLSFLQSWSTMGWLLEVKYAVSYSCWNRTRDEVMEELSRVRRGEGSGEEGREQVTSFLDHNLVWWGRERLGRGSNHSIKW